MRKLKFLLPILLLLGCAFSQQVPGVTGGAQCNGGCSFSGNSTQPIPPITFTSGLPPNGQTTVAYGATGTGFQFVAQGGLGTLSISLFSGTLPTGLILDPTGLLHSTPSVVNTFTFALVACDTEAPVPLCSQPTSFTVQITSGSAPPTVQTLSLNSGTVGLAYSQNVTATGGVGAYAWTVASGALPGWATLTVVSSVAQITGSPNAAGTSTFVLQVCDTVPHCSLSPSYSIVINAPPLRITNLAPPNGQTTVLYGAGGAGFQFATSGGTGTVNWGLAQGSGPLPTGLILDLTGLLHSIPTAIGSFSFTAQASDSGTPQQQVSNLYTIQITNGAAAPNITSSCPTGLVVGVPFSAMLLATGGATPFVWHASPTIPPPAGMTFVTSANNGVFAGTPSVVGSTSTSFTVTDANSQTSAPLACTLSVAASTLSITNPAPPSGTAGMPYLYNLTGAGGTGTGYNWSETGPLPLGMVLTPSTGLLGGTLDPSSAGSYNVTVTLTDSGGHTATANYTLVVAGTGGASFPIAPILGVNSHEFDADLAAPAVTKHILAAGGGDYAWTCAGIQQSITDWAAASDQAWLVLIDPGDLPVTPGTCFQIKPKVAGPPVHFYIAESSNPPTRNQTLCAHNMGVNGTRNLGCTNDIAHTWHVQQSNVNSSVVSTAGLVDANGNGPSHYAFLDIQASPATTTTTTNAAVQLGLGSENTVAALPSHIHWQYSYIHGDAGDTFTSGTPPGNNIMANGMTFNCVYCSVMWSYFDKITRPGSEGHIISIVNNPGPFKINNNWTEGSSSSVFCGGQVPAIPGILSCQDWEIRMNRFTYPLAWIGAFWGSGHGPVRKNGFELKETKRGIFSGNIVEYVDQTGGQGGPCVDIDVRQLGGGPIGENYIATIQDLLMSYNILRNCLGVQNDAKSGGGGNGGGNATGGTNLMWLGNLLYNLDGSVFCKDGTTNSITSCSPYKIPATETEIASFGQSSVWTITTATQASTLVTITTQLPTNIANGNSIVVAGVGVAGYNGTFTVSVVDSTHFTYTTTAGLSASTGGTATLAQPGCVGTRSGTSNNITLVCPTGGNGYQQTNMSPTDPVSVQSCADTTFNTSLSSIGPPALAGTTFTGLTVVYNNGSTGAATTTGCVLRNNQGWWNNFQWVHNTVVANTGVPGSTFGPYISSCPIGGNTAGFARHVTMRDNLWALDAWGGFNGNGAAEGSTGLKPAESCYDLGTFAFDHNAFAERSGANYTAFPSGLKGNATGSSLWFPTTPQCSTTTPSVNCIGFKGMLTNTFIQNPADYHDFQLCVPGLGTCGAASLFAAGQAQQASDGTDVGANIAAIDAAQILNTYVCAAPCTTVFYPSIGKVIVADPAGSDSNPGSPALPVLTVSKVRSLIAGTAGSLGLFNCGFFPLTSVTFTTADSGTTLLPITYSGCSASNPLNFLGQANYDTSITRLNANNSTGCLNGTLGCNAAFSGLSTNGGNTNAQTQVVDPAPKGISLLPISNYLYSGSVAPIDCYYQNWFLNTGGHNGHVNIGMDESNLANIAAQAASMVARGCTDVNIDWYGTDASQAYNLGVSNNWASYLATNPQVPLKLAIMLDQGALSPFCTTSLPTWSSVTTYFTGAGVTFSGQGYIAIGGSTNKPPNTNPSLWETTETCLIAAMESQFDYIDANYGSQPFYVKDSSGRPLVWYFIDKTLWSSTNFTTIYTAVHTYAQSHYPGRVYQILDEFGSFATAGTDGQYGWPPPSVFVNGSPNSQCQWDDSTGGAVCNFSTGVGSGTSYTQTLYNACKANPTKHCIGILFKGFDDSNASWGTNRIRQQGCSQVPVLLAGKINSNFSMGSPIERVGWATWNDYEEGTEIETGIDNCARPTIGIATDTLTYTVNPTDATFYSNTTVDHLTILYGPADGSGNLRVALDGIAPTATTQNLSGIIPVGTWSIYVNMVGKPGVINRQAGPVSYSRGTLPITGGQTILSGGQVFNPGNGFTWTTGTGTCNHTCQEWDVSVPASVFGSNQPEALYYNGVRRLRPCLPYSNGTCGYYTQSSPDGTHTVTFSATQSSFFPLQGNAPSSNFECYGCYHRDPLDTQTVFHGLSQFTPADDCTAPGTAPGVHWVEIMALERWTGARMRLCNKINDTLNTYLLTTTQLPVTGLTTAAPPNFGPFAGQSYFLDNVFEAFNQIGQWYMDPCPLHTDCSSGLESTWTLRYNAALNENPNVDQVVMPVNNTIMTANNLASVNFRNFTVSHDNFTIALAGQPGISDASNIQAATSFSNAVGLKFDGIVSAHMMHWGRELVGVSTGNSVTNDIMFDLGSGGSRIGKVETSGDTSANVSSGNTIFNAIASGGQRFMPGGTGVAFWIGNAHDNSIINATANDWYNGAYGVGGSQGYCGTFNTFSGGICTGTNHIFANNNLLKNIVASNIGQGVTSDMGGSHFHFGLATGNVMDGFYFHDITQDPTNNTFWQGYNGEGIYVDNSSSNSVVKNGLVVRTSEASILVNSAIDGFGQNNTVTNVIFAYGKLGCLKKSGDGTVFQVAYSHFICYIDKGNSHNGPQFDGGSAWINPARWSIANNTYFNPVTSLGTGTPWYQTVGGVRAYKTFAQWQAIAAGNDSGSTNTVDPGFIGPTFLQGDNYQFKTTPPSGFLPFSVGAFGAQGLPAIPVVPETFTLRLLNPNTDF